MYIRKGNVMPTSSVGKRETVEERKLDYENARKSPRYGLTWTPSRDENLSTGGAHTSSSRNLNAMTVNERRDERSFGTAYELNRSVLEDASRADRERSFEKDEKFSIAVASRANSNDLDVPDYWLSGEKFFRTPPTKYKDNDDDFTIPTRDKSDGDEGGGDGDGDCEGPKQRRKSKWHSSRRNDVSLDLFELSFTRAMEKKGDTSKTLIDSFDDVKMTNESNEDHEGIATIRKPLFEDRRGSSFPSSGSHEEGKTETRIYHGSSSRSTSENVSLVSSLNVLEGVAVPGTANIHNHIYLPSGYLDRYFDIPLTKFLQLTRRNVRASRIRRRILLKRSKRSRSRLVGPAFRNSTIKFEVENVNNNNEEKKGRSFLKRDIHDLLAEIEAELSANCRSVESLREKLPDCITVDTASTPEIRRKLKEVVRRCKEWIRNSNDREEATVRMNNLLAKTVDDLREVVKRESFAILQEEHYYTRLQLESIRGRQDFDKMKRLRNDVGRTSFDREEYINKMRKLLNTALVLTNDIGSIEDNKENIKKTINRKTNDHDSPRNRPANNKADVKASRAKNIGPNVIKKESQMETQMSLLSKGRPSVASTGKGKAFTKDVDGNKERVKDKTLRHNEDRTERQTLDKARRSVYTVSSNFGSHVNGGTRLENSKVIKDKKKDSPTRSPFNADVQFSDRQKPPIFRRKRQTLSNTPQPAWKPGGAVKSFASNSTTFLHVEPSSRRTSSVPCDKENPEFTRPVTTKRTNLSEPTASKRSVLKENRKNDNFREERVTKLCKLLAEVKMQKGPKDGTNALSDTRSSTYGQSEMSSSGTLITTERSFRPKPRPGITRSAPNNKNDSNVLQHDTEILFQDKSGVSLPSKKNSIDFSSNISVKFVAKDAEDKAEDRNVRDEKNSIESAKIDVTESTMLLTVVPDKLSTEPTNVRSSSSETLKSDSTNSRSSSSETLKSDSTNDESDKTKSITEIDSELFDLPQETRLTETTLNAIDEINVDRDTRLERRPSFVSFVSAGCNATLSTASNSATMVTSKCCQVSSTALSSKTCSSYDRLLAKKQSSEIVPPTTIEKDSLESSTDDDNDENEFAEDYSNDRVTLNFDLLQGRLNEHEMSLNDLKEFLRKHVLKRAEIENELKGRRDGREKSIKESTETTLLFNNASTTSISTEKTSLAKVSIGPESDSNRSNYSTSTDSRKIDESMTPVALPRTKSKGSQTVSDLKEFSDACTDVEDIKSDYTMCVDAIVSCYELGSMKGKDVATETFAQDKSTVPRRRVVQTQTYSRGLPAKSVLTNFLAKLAKNERDRTNDRNDRSTETEDLKCDEPPKRNKDEDIALIQEDVTKNVFEKSSESLLNSTDGLTVKKSSLSESLIRPSEDIDKDQLRSVDGSVTMMAPNSLEVETFTARILKEPSERFDQDREETNDDGISGDIMNALQTIELYGTNLHEAIQIYRERSNDECVKGTTFSSSSESVAVSKVSKDMEHDTCANVEDVNEDFGSHGKDLNEEEREIDELRTTDYSSDSSNEFDETKSRASSVRFKDLYVGKMAKETSQKSSYSSIPFETNVTTERVSRALNVKDRRLGIIKYSDCVLGSGDGIEKGREIDDSSDFVLSREALLLLTYLTICVFVFCCLKFSMTCESFLL